MSNFYKLNIAEIRKETAAAVSILFSVPSALKENYVFKAGQYINLKLTMTGTKFAAPTPFVPHPKVANCASR